MSAVFDARPAALDVFVPQGNDLVLSVAVTDDAGDAYPLAGTVAAQLTTANGALVLDEFTVAGTPSVDGTCALTLTAAVTAARAVAGYAWRLVWTNGSGRVRTLVAGACAVTPPSTPGESATGTVAVTYTETSITVVVSGFAQPPLPVLDGFYLRNATDGLVYLYEEDATGDLVRRAPGVLESSL
jgi:hypothetical protein